MKRNSRKTLIAAISAVSLMITFCAAAANNPQAAGLGVQLSASTTEMPAQAAQIVAAAAADQREATTKAVVLQALNQRPTLAPAVVGAIAKSSPDMAAIAAVTAITQQPAQIGQITKAAVAAAPQQAANIVKAICEKYPNQFNIVAVAAAEAAPDQGKQIIAAVSSAVPTVKAYIDLSQATTVAGIISDAQYELTVAAKSANTTPDSILASGNTGFAYAPLAALPTPTVGPPFQAPVNNTPTVISGSSAVIVPQDEGRGYSAPVQSSH
jgi:hypothetical protein